MGRYEGVADRFGLHCGDEMPRRDDLDSILILGSGPIVIGQACEFDYSGTQACRVLRSEGYRVILVNSNPATIMTDPEFADATYVEPLIPETVEKIICHQVGSGHRDQILEALGIPMEKDFSTYKYLGNIGTVSLPITAALAEEREFLQSGDRVALLGIGSGLTCMMVGVEW